MSAGGRPRIYDDIDPLSEKPSVKKWLSALAEGDSRRASLYSLARYLRHLKDEGLESDPDRLIDQCLEGNNRALVDHVSRAVEYCQRYPSDNRETVLKQYRRIRSFYQHNFITLPRATLKIQNHARSVGREITANEFLGFVRKVLRFARLSPRDRAVILTMLQSGMDASTLCEVFNFVGYPQLVGVLNDPSKCPARVDLIRPKSGQRYYTFLDLDAVEALREYLGGRGRGLRVHPAPPNELPRSDPIFVDQNDEPLDPRRVSVIFREAGVRAGINVRDASLPMEQFRGARIRYPFHSHEVRDTMITLARSAKADAAAANFFVGHSIDRLKYDKSPWNDADRFRQEYLKIARPHLNPTSGEVLRVRAELESNFEARLATLERRLQDGLTGRFS